MKQAILGAIPVVVVGCLGIYVAVVGWAWLALFLGFGTGGCFAFAITDWRDAALERLGREGTAR